MAEKVWLDTYTYKGRPMEDRIQEFIDKYGINYLD